MPSIQAQAHYERTDGKWLAAMDGAERDALIAKYTPLVKFLANRIAMRLPPNVCVDDLVSAGRLGLLDAIERFDPCREVKLKTYAEFRIRGAILDELRTMDWIPRSVRKNMREIKRATKAAEHKLKGPAKDSEVAKQMAVDLETYYEMLDKTQDVELLSLDDSVDAREERGGSSRSYSVLVQGDDNPVDHVMTQEIKQVIASNIKALPKKEQMVVSLYYYDGLTLKEIGKILGLTESRVSQIHTQTITRLRTRLKSYFQT
jgi:RNA polymerase sigma factor for flagellar operon FliA